MAIYLLQTNINETITKQKQSRRPATSYIARSKEYIKTNCAVVIDTDKNEIVCKKQGHTVKLLKKTINLSNTFFTSPGDMLKHSKLSVIESGTAVLSVDGREVMTVAGKTFNVDVPTGLDGENSPDDVVVSRKFNASFSQTTYERNIWSEVTYSTKLDSKFDDFYEFSHLQLNSRVKRFMNFTIFGYVNFQMADPEKPTMSELKTFFKN